jgi:two-component system, OmpR family, response regulator ChvI
MDVSIGKKESSNLFFNDKTLPDVIGNNKTNQEEASSGRLSVLTSQYEQNDLGKVPFADYSEKVCVSVIDIVGSTSIVSTIGNSKDIRNFTRYFLIELQISSRNIEQI